MSHGPKKQQNGSFSSGSNKSNMHQQGESRSKKEQQKALGNKQRPRGGKAKNRDNSVAGMLGLR